MPLAALNLPEAGAPLPQDMRVLAVEGERRVRAFLDERGGAVAGFVPSDFERVGKALRAVVQADLAPGRAFMEWGDGL